MDYLDALLLFVEQWLGSLPEVVIVFLGVSLTVLFIVAFWERLIGLPELIVGLLLAISLVANQYILMYFPVTRSNLTYLLWVGPLCVVVMFLRSIYTRQMSNKALLVVISLFTPALLSSFVPNLNRDFLISGVTLAAVTTAFCLIFLSIFLIAMIIRQQEVWRQMVMTGWTDENLNPRKTRLVRGTKIGAPFFIALMPLAVFITGSLSPQPMVGDEVTHYFMLTKQAEDLSRPNFFSHIPHADGSTEIRRYPHSFLWHYMGAVLYRLSEASFFTIQFYQAAFYFQLLFVGYLLARSRGGVVNRSALVYLLVLGTLPVVLTLSVAFYQDVAMTAQAMTAFYFIERRKYFWAALFMTIAMAFKINALLLFPAFFLLLAYRLVGEKKMWKAITVFICAVVIVLGSTWLMGRAITTYAQTPFYPQEQLVKLVDSAQEKIQAYFSAHNNLGSGDESAAAGTKTLQFSNREVKDELVPVIIANHPGDLRITKNFFIYGGAVLWVLICGALVASLAGLPQRANYLNDDRNTTPATWLWLTGGSYLLCAVLMLWSAPDARFFLPGLVFILLPISERFVKLPKPKIMISIIAILALFQGGYVLAKTYRLRMVSDGLLEAIHYLEHNPPTPKRIFMYPEGNYRLFPADHEWYLGYRLREFWRSDNSHRIDILRQYGVGAVVIKKHLIMPVDDEITNLGVYPPDFVTDIQEDKRFVRVFENDDVTIYHLLSQGKILE
jgi:hypothetical protein